MPQTTPIELPNWLDRAAYPFVPKTFPTPEGRLSYVDVGNGQPIVFVHGTPSWSFEWRHLLQSLSITHRCLALDHLGFGLSDKPTSAGYRPEDHAARFAAWMEFLALERFTLVVHDFGGPIGLSYALTHPEQVRAIVVINTWMWSLANESRFALTDKWLGGGFGRYLYLKLGFSANVILPSVYGDRKKLTPQIHTQYKAPLSTPETRFGTLGMLHGLVGSSAWYDSLYQQRARLQKIPMLLVWGKKDSAFPPSPFLSRWEETFPAAEVAALPDAGHWPQEEEPEFVAERLRTFLQAISLDSPNR